MPASTPRPRPAQITPPAGPHAVTIAVSGRNNADTLADCLASAAAMLDDPRSPVADIIYSDAGSTDASRDIAAGFPARALYPAHISTKHAQHAAVAAAATPLVWLISANCSPHPQPLEHLLEKLDTPGVSAAAGLAASDANASALAVILDEENALTHRTTQSATPLADPSTHTLARVHPGPRPGVTIDTARTERCTEPIARLRRLDTPGLRRYLRSQFDDGGAGPRTPRPARPRARFDDAMGLTAIATAPLTPAAAIPAVHPAFATLPAATLALVAAAAVPMTAAMLRRTADARCLAYPLIAAARAAARGAGILVRAARRAPDQDARAAHADRTPASA